jgi:hypothetical protein
MLRGNKGIRAALVKFAGTSLLLVPCAVPIWAQPPTAADPPASGSLSDQPPAESTELETPPSTPNTAVPPSIPAVPPIPGTRPSPLTPPPAATLRPPASTRSLPSLDQLAMRRRSAPSLRLASVPNMLGDFSMPYLTASIDTNLGQTLVDLPLGAGGLRTKISENNKALPMDRVYFQYHHFHNAYEVVPDVGTPGLGRTWNLDRFTFGFEKTFCDEIWSVDIRMPVAVDRDLSLPGFGISSGYAGNLNLILKRSLAENEYSAWATGVGVNLPTGSDAQINTSFDYMIKNEAVHLSPFIGMMSQPTRRVFYHAFCEIDLPTNGHSVSYTDQTGSTAELGTLTEQTLLQLDGSVGYWLYRNQCAPLLTGLASVMEIHYTSTLNDGDVVSNGGDQFGSALNRVDLLNMTIGLHGVLNRQTTFRVGGVLPLRDEPDRGFDAELLFSLNRYF